jgi:hypothetical protein
MAFTQTINGKEYTFFPVSRANQISVKYWEALVEMKNPYAHVERRSNGSHHYETYHKLDTP